jgi:hypothetical protein
MEKLVNWRLEVTPPITLQGSPYSVEVQFAALAESDTRIPFSVHE